MTEQPKCHQRVGDAWVVHCDGGTLTLREGACPCAGCRTYLNADGTETPMVPAALSQSAGLAAAESQTTLSAVVCAAEELALHAYPAPDERPGLGKTAWFLLPHDEKLSRWITILNRRALAAVGAPTSERADAGPSDSELLDALEWAATDGATICGEQCCEGEHSRWTAEGDGLHLKANCVYDLASAIHFSPKPAPEPDPAHQRAGEGAGR